MPAYSSQSRDVKFSNTVVIDVHTVCYVEYISTNLYPCYALSILKRIVTPSILTPAYVIGYKY